MKNCTRPYHLNCSGPSDDSVSLAPRQLLTCLFYHRACVRAFSSNLGTCHFASHHICMPLRINDLHAHPRFLSSSVWGYMAIPPLVLEQKVCHRPNGGDSRRKVKSTREVHISCHFFLSLCLQSFYDFCF